tara:strand:- start:2790 stop:3029 length:240 start_codon:yes stop_codon:yes gene_type:complete
MLTGLLLFTSTISAVDTHALNLRTRQSKFAQLNGKLGPVRRIFTIDCQATTALLTGKTPLAETMGDFEKIHRKRLCARN